MFSLFDIFEEMLKNLDSLWEKRNLAWISEFVSTLFFLKYIRDNHNNVEFLPISFVQNTIENKMVGAVKIVENHLSYKIGKKIIHSKGLINILLLPFSIICIYFNHYLEKYIYNISIKYNPNSKRIKLEEYSDYDEAVRIQNYLSYKIGKIFVKNPFLFAIRLYFLKKERKNEKK
ncbi:hypothetical protein QRA80_001835 [Campylobacter jejuni]|nr:hypothetical protein [Campylobacter jejuni]EHN8564129.1 hypothetical protein [Campylobacter jejuni]ELR8492177.1 hypothetical protein [Campylobacter jejuni]